MLVPPGGHGSLSGAVSRPQPGLAKRHLGPQRVLVNSPWPGADLMRGCRERPGKEG